MEALAKKWLLEYMSDGIIRAPCDFDEDFLGGVDYTGALGITDMAWNKTPFFKALGNLVKSGDIKHWTDDDGHHYLKG